MRRKVQAFSWRKAIVFSRVRSRHLQNHACPCVHTVIAPLDPTKMQIDCVSSKGHDPCQPTYCQFDDQPVTVKAEYEPESNIYRCTVPEEISSLRHRLIQGDRPRSADKG